MVLYQFSADEKWLSRALPADPAEGPRRQRVRRTRPGAPARDPRRGGRGSRPAARRGAAGDRDPGRRGRRPDDGRVHGRDRPARIRSDARRGTAQAPRHRHRRGHRCGDPSPRLPGHRRRYRRRGRHRRAPVAVARRRVHDVREAAAGRRRVAAEQLPRGRGGHAEPPVLLLVRAQRLAQPLRAARRPAVVLLVRARPVAGRGPHPLRHRGPQRDVRRPRRRCGRCASDTRTDRSGRTPRTW